MRINKHDTQGTKPLLDKGELGYDDYAAGGDVGRVYVGTGSENIALAEKSEIDSHVNRVDNPHNVTKAQVGLGDVDNTADVNKNVLSATKWTTARTITLSGDVAGSVSMDGTANVSITTTVQPNSVALGTDTTGNYVAGATAGTGISVTGTAGEGWSPTIAIDSTVATLTGAQTLTNKTLQDSTTFIVDNTDATKKVQFDVAGVTTATTRTLTVPNINGTIITTGDTGTVTSTMIADGTIVNTDINASAAIVDTKLATISTAGKVSNSATTATNLNTASAIVARDASGNFSAGTITASLSGNSSTATALATGRTIGMTGDVTWTSASFDGTGNVTGAATLSNSGVTSGSYSKVTVDAKGRVTAGLTPTMEDIPDATFKRSVRVATTANIILSATQTIDDIVLAVGDRVLVKDQTAQAENGIYVVSSTAWTRSLDADTASKIASALVAVDSGTVNGGKLFDNDFKTTDTLGTTAMLWASNLDSGHLSSSIPIVAGTGSAGTAVTISRSDHVHPAQTTITGNAGTATALQTGRTIGMTGDVTYTSGSFNGSANVTGTATLATVTDSGTGTFKKITVDTKGRVTGTAAVAQSDITGLLGAGSITNTMLANSAVANLSGTNTGDQTITLTGDVTGTGTGSFATTLANTTVVAGTYGSATLIPTITVDNKGRLTGVSTNSIFVPSGSISVTGGDLTMSGTTGTAITNATLSNTGVTAGTYTKITVDSKGRATSGTTLSASDIPTLNQNTTGSAGRVVNSEVIKFDTGTTEGTDLYTFNGSAAKTINIIAGTNVSLTKAAGSITINANGTSIAWSEVTSKPTTISGYGISDAYTKTEVDTSLVNKVDKVTGKGLSTEDYTTAEKTKLAGVEAGAQVNTVISVAGKTGAVSLAKSDVGLGNVTNESKATMFTNPTFIGTATGTFSGSLSGNATTATNVAWSGITAKPTSLSGYGITDSVKNFGTVTVQGVAGSNQSCTTDQFITWLSNIGALSQSCVMKCTWDYAGNNDISDTGFGTLETAGCFIQVMSDGAQYIIRITSPSTGTGAGGIHEYINHGSGYSPGWRRVYTSNLNGNITGNAATATTASACGGNSATATLATKASTLAMGGANGTASTWNWSGQGGQPSWLWGGSDGTNMYVYNPANFSVNYANTAGNGGVTSVNGMTGAVTIASSNYDAAHSFAQNGYQKFSNGLILQWGITAANTNNSVTSTFPIAFPTACLQVVGSTVSSKTDLNYLSYVISHNSSSVTFLKIVTSYQIKWFAVGY